MASNIHNCEVNNDKDNDLSCNNVKLFFSSVRCCFIDCYHSAKNWNPYILFPCLIDKNIFVDLESGYNGRHKTRRSENKQHIEEDGIIHNEAIHLEKGEVLCKKCNKRVADVVILPCGHGTYCNKCLELWHEWSNKCPDCNVVMTDVVQCI